MGDTEILALIAEARKYTLLSIVTRLADALEQMRRERDEAVILRDEHYVVAKSQNDRAEAAEQRVGELTKAARWVLHVVNGVGRAGVEPEPGEYEAALDALRAALERNPK